MSLFRSTNLYNPSPANMPFMDLPEEMYIEVVLQLQPRHLYKLMQTNRKLYKLCTSEKYWRRVALHVMGARDGWMYGLDTPIQMFLLDRSYKATMDDFIGRFRVQMAEIEEMNMTDDIARGGEVPFDYLAASMESLVVRIQESRFRRVIVGETAFQLSRRYVEDAGTPSKVMFNVNDTGGTGTALVTERRFANRVAQKFLRILDDDNSISLETKHRLRDAAHGLLCGYLINGTTHSHGHVRSDYIRLY